MTQTQKLFHKDFTLMVIGQIISIFGNQIVSFALSLYILDLTNSASMFATILVVSKIPNILLSLIGGISADRLPRKAIMVVLDFFTAFSLLMFSLLMKHCDIIALTAAFMILLSSIQAFYQPSVSASIPAITAKEQLTAANSVTTGINAVATLAAPALGGMLYGFFGITPILNLAMLCFFLSALLELFLHIPFEKQTPATKGLWIMIRDDFKSAWQFVTKEHPIFFQMLLTLTGLNFLISAMITVGLPYIIKIQLGLSSQLYGIVESGFAIGMMIGALIAVKGKQRFTIHNAYLPLQLGIISITMITFSILTLQFPMPSYYMILLSVLVGMSMISVFNIIIQAYMQERTPSLLLGKVSSFTMMITQLAVPLGQALFGMLFDQFASYSAWIVLIPSLFALGIAAKTRSILRALPPDQCA